MSSEEQGSVTHWIDALKEGDARAAERLWHRYFDELVRIARARLGKHARGASDEEDVALSAFHSLCAGAAENRFARLGGRDDLWRLMVTITVRKALDQVQRERRKKRGGGHVVREAELAMGESSDAKPGFDGLAAEIPTPDVAVMLDEEYRRLFDCLGDDSLRCVAALRLEGYTGEEIAAKLGCNRRTVTRKLELIRQTWLEASPP
jgi:DNA-directed RNA polymerase specialized sigma24 family protein